MDDLRAVVVDDEQLARDELCFQLGRVGGVEVVGQAGNGVDAVRVITDSEPDVVLLDVQMPGLTGFEVARRLLDGSVDAHIVFVTAFDEYALEAFEVNAVDYLLKPVEPKRLEQAIDKVRRRVTPSGDRGSKPAIGHEDLERLLQLVADRRDLQEQLAVKVGERFLLIAADEIVHASVENDAITVVTGTVSGTSNYRTLDELQTKLDPAVFWRVHRSHLVNIQKIKEIVPWFSRNYILKMKDAKGSEIPVSRSQTRRLRDYLRL
jgi:two-component system response regulator LytT